MQHTRTSFRLLAACVVAVLMATPAVQACCGVYPTITDNLIDIACVGQDVSISGTVTGTEAWSSAYSTGPVKVTVQVSSPSGEVTTMTASLSNLQEYRSASPRYATWDFEALYTATEAGTYTYVKIVEWTSAFGWTESNSASGTFDVVQCEGKTTGGGWFLMPGASDGKGLRNTFGFVAQYVAGKIAPQGNLEFQGHGGAINVKSSDITGLFVSGDTATFRGTCSVNGESGFTFIATVVDNAEPGKDNDTFAITVPLVLAIPPTTLDSGNIQVRQ